MRKAVMILLALLAIRLLPRALRREARALELITLLFELTAAAIVNTSKTVSTTTRTGTLEIRAGGLEQGIIPNLQPSSTVGLIQGRVNSLSGAQTTQNGLTDSRVSGTTDLCNGSGGGTGTTSSSLSGANAHTHQYQHSHTAGNLGLVPGGGLHVHNLPTV